MGRIVVGGPVAYAIVGYWRFFVGGPAAYAITAH
jgi:hypothetical protein